MSTEETRVWLQIPPCFSFLISKFSISSCKVCVCTLFIFHSVSTLHPSEGVYSEGYDTLCKRVRFEMCKSLHADAFLKKRSVKGTKKLIVKCSAQKLER